MTKGTFGSSITTDRIADNISITTTGTLDVSGGTLTTSPAQKQEIAASDIALAQNLENKTLTSPVINSPVINTAVSGTAVLDEDDFASDSDTQIATQQSIKAYVDASGVTYNTGTLTNFLYEGGTQVTSGPSTYTCNYTQIGRVYHVLYHVVWNAYIETTGSWAFSLPAGITSDQGDGQSFGYRHTSGLTGHPLPGIDYATEWRQGYYKLTASDDRLVLLNSSGSTFTPRAFSNRNTFILNITYQAI